MEEKMTVWSVRCSCGYDPDKTSERHYDMIDASVTHQIAAPTAEDHDTEIYEVEDDG